MAQGRHSPGGIRIDVTLKIVNFIQHFDGQMGDI